MDEKKKIQLEQIKRWKLEHKDKVREYAKKYKKNHKEKVNELTRRWVDKNKERVLKKQEEYRNEHKEEIALKAIERYYEKVDKMLFFKRRDEILKELSDEERADVVGSKRKYLSIWKVERKNKFKNLNTEELAETIINKIFK